jgi:diguanylate cyclase (GGDEF)-like protein
VKRSGLDRRQRLIARCLADLRLSSILLMGVVTATVIVPFAVFRALNGQWQAAGVDTILVLGICCAVLHAARTGRTGVAGTVIAIFVAAGAVAVTTLIDIAGVFWMYTVMIATFLLAPRWLALAANAGVIAGALLIPGVLDNPSLRLTFVATAGLITLYALGTSLISDYQRAQLERLASHDPLTGVPNRRMLEVELEQVLATHLRAGLPAGLAVLDLDHFKAVNDEHGHVAGDAVLVAFTRLLQESIRKRDRLYRFGGEEFVLLLPSTTADGVARALEKLHALLGERLRGPSGPVHTSIGAAMLQSGDDWRRWLDRADAALYAAKRGGRNRICMDADTLPTAATV